MPTAICTVSGSRERSENNFAYRPYKKYQGENTCEKMKNFSQVFFISDWTSAESDRGTSRLCQELLQLFQRFGADAVLHMAGVLCGGFGRNSQ